MFELMTVKPSVTNVADAEPLTSRLSAAEADITFENITFSYVEGKKILDK